MGLAKDAFVQHLPVSQHTKHIIINVRMPVPFPYVLQLDQLRAAAEADDKQQSSARQLEKLVSFILLSIKDFARIKHQSFQLRGTPIDC